MFGSFIVELVLGILFVIATLAIISTALTEAVLAILKTRSNNLEQWLQVLSSSLGSGRNAGGPALSGSQVLDHPLLASSSKEGGKPSYLRPEDLAEVLFDFILHPDGSSLLAKEAVEVETELRGRVTSLESPEMKRVLTAALDSAAATAKSGAELVQHTKVALAGWLDSGMSRMEGWTKRKARWISIGISIVVCAVLNANVADMASRLSVDSASRGALAKQATEAIQKEAQTKCEAEADPVAIARCHADVAAAGVGRLEGMGAIGIGWEPPPRFVAELRTPGDERTTGALHLLAWLAGILLTAMAVSLGGDFWFKVLGDVIRLTGPKPGTPGSK